MTPSMPKKTAVPNDWRISAPAPWARTSGTHTQDKGKRSHENRAQAQPAGFDRGRETILTGVLLLTRKFHD